MQQRPVTIKMIKSNNILHMLFYTVEKNSKYDILRS